MSLLPTRLTSARPRKSPSGSPRPFAARALTLSARSVDEVDLSVDGFDAYVVGSAVHAGHWLKPAKQFVERHAADLERRPVWLFSSGPIGDTAVHAPQPDPKEIGDFRRLIEPRAHIVFAGAFDRAAADAKGGLLERTFGRFIPEGDFRDWPAIEGWARGIARELSRDMVTA